MRFVDRAAVRVRAGDGGDGSASFRREKYVPRGGPDGGDGGDGGDVLIAAVSNVNSLYGVAARRLYRAGDGGRGAGKKRHGARGRDVIIRVPVGTVVTDEETGLVLLDLAEARDPVVVAKGGKGGRGNVHFKSSVNRTPTQWEKGEPGRERLLRLELKLVADVGLIGQPNAGKSTLLSRLSAAHPKIAPYPFTTLIPEVGTVETGAYERFTVADMPGLIEGAHRGKGLGDQFLRHIERTRVLVHVVDGAPADGSDPAGNYRAIREELARYSADLAAKTEVVVVNKLDLPGAERGLAAVREAVAAEVLGISALTGEGIAALEGRLAEAVKAAAVGSGKGPSGQP